jgi:putative endonuclease
MESEKQPAVYILANRYRGTIYIGVTSALWNRVADHKNGNTPGFTSQHGCKLLVWYEHHHSMDMAIKREKAMKAWQRHWKFRIIETMNPNWLDLHDEIDPIGTLVPYSQH